MDLTLRGPGAGIESSADAKIRSLTREVEKLAALIKGLIKDQVDKNKN